MLSNKWTQGTTHFILPPLPFGMRASEGLIPWRMALDPRIGTEIVLLLIERTPFIYDLAKVRPFDLLLKAGMVRTSYGPLCFFLFYVPDPTLRGKVYFAVEAHLNPLDADHLIPWRDLARQSHWHIVLVDANDTIVDLFEFQNNFNIEETLSIVESACESTTCSSFDKVKAEFMAKYSIDDLFKL